MHTDSDTQLSTQSDNDTMLEYLTVTSCSYCRVFLGKYKSCSVLSETWNTKTFLLEKNRAPLRQGSLIHSDALIGSVSQRLTF